MPLKFTSINTVDLQSSSGGQESMEHSNTVMHLTRSQQPSYNGNGVQSRSLVILLILVHFLAQLEALLTASRREINKQTTRLPDLRNSRRTIRTISKSGAKVVMCFKGNAPCLAVALAVAAVRSASATAPAVANGSSVFLVRAPPAVSLFCRVGR